MEKPKEIDGWNVSDRIQVPDGYDMKSIPDMTQKNFNFLIEQHNNLVEIINELCRLNNINFDE